MSRTFTARGIVLSRKNTGETDRVVKILTQEYGKLICVAKGVRKLKSSKSGTLEPGNLVKAFFIKTKSLPLLTQAVLIDNFNLEIPNQVDLATFRKLSQILEIFDKLIVEEELDVKTFNKAVLLRSICQLEGSGGKVRKLLGEFIEELGFQHPDDTKFETISDYLEDLLARPLKSYNFLKVN